MPGRQRLLHVEGLRALAAYVVFIDHAFAQVWNYYSGLRPPSALSLCSYSLVAGHLAVAVFITISGFCLALPVLRDGDHLRSGTRDFLAKRARRIL
ncbi:MAG TPA: acyltransferase family protein, partial [Polyangiaceae bacterium]|nr:acyltransferase family protein [Polyangiaceae bacterium]